MAGRWQVVLAMLVAALVGAAAFCPSLPNEFVYDDRPIIVTNPLVTQPGSWYRFWQHPWWPREESSDKLYRPLAVWTLRANLVLAGHAEPNPYAFRLVNVALHALAGAGVALAAWRLIRRPAAAWIAGLLFAVHPIHTEAVVTGYGRAELLAGCLSAWLLARYLRDPPAGRWAAMGFHLFNTLLFLGAVMSKEHALFVWPVLLLFDLWRRREVPTESRVDRRTWVNQTLAPAHLGFICAVGLFMFLRYQVFGWNYVLDASRTVPWEDPMHHVGFIERLLTPFRLTFVAIELLFRPGRLCPIWSITELLPADRLAWDVVIGLSLWVAATAGAVLCWRRRSRMGLVFVGLMVTLAVPVHAVPMAHWLFAERWLYLPTVFMAIGLAAILVRLARLAVPFTVAAVFLLLPTSWQYGSAFADNLTMNREVVRRQPDNYQGRRNLAIVLYYQGRYTEAIQAAEEIIERFIDPPVWSDRFGTPRTQYLVLLKSFLALGDGRRALVALDAYESLQLGTGEPSLTAEREQALALIAGEDAPAP